MAVERDRETSSAPGDLEIVRGFVNTLDVEEGTEEFDVPAGLESWLAQNKLGTGGSPSDADVARAIDFREALRSLLLANNGAELVDDDAAERLNAALDGAASEVRFEGGSAEIVPTCSGLDAALATMALIVHDAMVSGEWL